MLMRALAGLGLGAAAVATAAPAPELYEPMFCDRPAPYRPTAPGPAAAWQGLLFGPAPDAAAVHPLAADSANDSGVALFDATTPALPAGALLALDQPRNAFGGVEGRGLDEHPVDPLKVLGRERSSRMAGGGAQGALGPVESDPAAGRFGPATLLRWPRQCASAPKA